MARGFRSASSNYFSAASVPVSGYPFAIGCFFRYTVASTSSGDMTIASISDAGDAAGGFRLMAYGTGSGSGFSARASTGAGGGTDREAKYAMTVDSTNYRWVMGVWRGDADREIFVAGDAGAFASAASTANCPAPTMSTFDIGRWFAGGAATIYLTGSVGYLTVWDADFTATEAADYFTAGAYNMASHVDPRGVKPNNIVFCWRGQRLASAASNDADQWGQIALTNGNSPTINEDPPIMRAAGW